MKSRIIVLIVAVLAITVILSGCADKMGRFPVNSSGRADDEATGITTSTDETHDIATTSADISTAESSPESMGKPEDYPFNEEATALANEIISKLNADRVLARDILSGNMLEGAQVINGIDQNGNLLFIDTVDDDGTEYTQIFIPFKEPYDKIESIMEVMHRVYTEEKCADIYSRYYEDNQYIIEVDSRLYHIMSDVVLIPFNQPFVNAVRISDDEILAITTISYISVDARCEITFKNEDGKWKIDSIIEYDDIIGWRELDY